MPQVVISESIQINNALNPSGSPEVIQIAKSVPYTKEFRRTYTIPTLTAITIWDATSESASGVTDFDIAMFFSNGNIDLEFTTNEGDAAEALGTLRVVKDGPIKLFADDSYYNHSASDAFAGTLDVIDKIRAYNPTASSVSLQVFLGT